jgi:hypothetical protein
MTSTKPQLHGVTDVEREAEAAELAALRIDVGGPAPVGLLGQSTDDPLLADPTHPKAKPSKPARLPRTGRLFTPVELEWLKDPGRRGVFSAKVRLLLLVLVRSRRGARPVRLTNAMAAEVGVGRALKARCLQSLERDGFVSVQRRGRETIVVTVRPRPAPGVLQDDSTPAAR